MVAREEEAALLGPPGPVDHQPPGDLQDRVGEADADLHGLAYQVAKMRAWPPEPSSYGMSPTMMVAPRLGMRSRLARFSSP